MKGRGERGGGREEEWKGGVLEGGEGWKGGGWKGEGGRVEESLFHHVLPAMLRSML